jgi:hypothetical protein
MRDDKRPVAGSGEHSNELGSIKYWEFLQWLSSWGILKDDSAPLSYLGEAICSTIPRWRNLEEALRFTLCYFQLQVGGDVSTGNKPSAVEVCLNRA